MLVVKDRNALARLAKDGNDLLHHFDAGIEDLSLVVAWIVAVFAYEKHPVHGKFVRPVRQGVGDRPGQPKVKILCHAARQIIVRRLVHIHGADVTMRYVETAVARVALNEAPGNVIAMRQRPVDRRDHGNRFATLLAWLGRPGPEHSGGFACPGSRLRQAGSQRQSRRLAEEFATRETKIAVLHGSYPGRERYNEAGWRW